MEAEQGEDLGIMGGNSHCSHHPETDLENLKEILHHIMCNLPELTLSIR
jgi:hypothetical protein